MKEYGGASAREVAKGLHERLPNEEERPSSSAWQSEGFVNLRSGIITAAGRGEDLRSWVQIPSRAFSMLT
jgi:hypothetical protein